MQGEQGRVPVPVSASPAPICLVTELCVHYNMKMCASAQKTGQPSWAGEGGRARDCSVSASVPAVGSGLLGPEPLRASPAGRWCLASPFLGVAGMTRRRREL